MTYNDNKLSLTRSRYQRAGQLLQSRALHDRSGWHRDSRNWTKLTYAGYDDWCAMQTTDRHPEEPASLSYR